MGAKFARSEKKIFCPPLGAPRGGGKIWTVNSKYLASWILGISIRYLKLVHIQSNHLESTTLSLLQTKLAEKKIVSKKSTFY